MKLRVALVISHPVQHFCPQYVSFAQNEHIVFKAFFASALGYKKYLDPGFGKEIAWNNLELDKFDHLFLNGEEVLEVNGKLDAPALDQALLDFQPGVVISYGYYQLLQRRAHKWASRNKVPLAYISDSEKRHQRNFLKEIIKYLPIRKYFTGIRFFLTVGNANEDFYRYYGVSERQFIRMHFPIDIRHYEQEFANNQVLRNQVRRKYQIEAASIVITVVGKLVSWKNQDHLIDALILLEEQNIILDLIIVGSGEMQQPWEKKALALKKSRIYFTGFVSIDQLPAYYAATDIYVHPASVEPHSIAISEAIYMGCPVVVSDTSGSYGISDDVQTEENGFTYRFGDIDGLCLCIKKLAGNESLRSAFSKRSHQIAVASQQRAHKQVISELVHRLGDNNNKTGS